MPISNFEYFERSPVLADLREHLRVDAIHGKIHFLGCAPEVGFEFCVPDESVFEMLPPPELEYELDLSNAPPFLISWFAYTQNIPQSMRDIKRWCVWRRHPDGRKVPYRVLEGRYWSKSELAKCDSSETWTTFDEALFCFFNATGHLGGLSFALGDGWMGFDHDDVILDGQIHPQTKSWLARLGGYQEPSQSGKGIKNILRGTLGSDFLAGAETGKMFKGVPAEGMATEVYHCRRFFFLTGWGSGEPTENQQGIDAICSELTARKASKKPTPKPKPHLQTPPSDNIDGKALDYIDPDQIDYNAWLCVLTACKGHGLSDADADAWSRRGKKHKDRDVESRWQGLNVSKASWGTVVHLAKQGGYKPPRRATKRQSDALKRLAEQIKRRQQSSEEVAV